MSNKIIVIGGVVTKSGATFYTKEAKQVNLAASDSRISKFIEEVFTALNVKKLPEVEIDLDTHTVYTKIEENSKGLIKFFRVAKKKLASILGTTAERGNVNPGGMVHAPTSKEQAVQPGTPKVTDEQMEALVKEHSENAHKPSKISKNEAETITTVVAVVDKTPIVGAENFEKQVQHAIVSDNTSGMENFLKKLAEVASVRKHTAQEVVRFMKRMDLPITDDGCILAYKSLKNTSEPGVFRDIHSGTMPQSLGTLVSMDVEAVDDNRRVLCSNGLHIASRHYLMGYGTINADYVITIVKIDPRDIISVPLSEELKMRVSKYHIIAVLSDVERDALSKGSTLTAKNEKFQSMLAELLKGNHVGVLTTTHKGKDSKITSLVPTGNKAKEEVVVQSKIETFVPTKNKMVSLDDVEGPDPKIAENLQPKKLNAQMEKIEDTPVLILYRKWVNTKDDNDLAMLSRSLLSEVNKSLNPTQIAEVEAAVKAKNTAHAPKQEPVKKAPQKATKPAPAKTPAAPKKTPAKAPVKPADKPAAKALEVKKPEAKPNHKAKASGIETATKENNGSQAFILFNLWQASKTKTAWDELLAYKKKTKKSWTVLGLNDAQVKLVNEKLNQK